MVTRPPRHRTFTVAVLDLLRDASSRGEKLTRSEIEDRLLHRDPRYRSYYYYDWFRQSGPWLDNFLADLHEHGILETGLVSDGSAGDGTVRFSLNRNWMSVNDGQGPGGGGGLREVLAHRYLFALSEPDFNDALANAIGIE
jgi:hypothetical protein